MPIIDHALLEQWSESNETTKMFAYKNLFAHSSLLDKNYSKWMMQQFLLKFTNCLKPDADFCRQSNDSSDFNREQIIQDILQVNCYFSVRKSYP